MKIQILNCGGTLDKSYNPAREILEHTQTHLAEILDQARIKNLEIKTEEVFLKDSLKMQKKDFQKVAQACEKSTNKKILVIHGTSKMVESAKHTANKKLEKTIVFFGAMIPYEFKKTDAMFNFGFALAALQTLPHGVFITMNGQIFSYEEVKKNNTKAVFERI